MTNTTAQASTVAWKNWLLLLALATAWGGSFLFMKRGLTLFHYTEVAAVRIGIAAICLLPVLIARRKTLPHHRWKHAIAVALTGSTIPAMLFPLAQTRINSSLAGILNSTTPFWVMVIGAILFGASLHKQRILGILIGLVGVSVLILFRESVHTAVTDTNNFFGLFILFATFLYGISANIIGRYMSGIDALTGTAMGLVAVGIPALVYLFGFTNVPNLIFAYPPVGAGEVASTIPPFFYLVLLAFLNTVLGSIGYITLIQRTNPVFASIVTYIMPIFSTIIGILDGETVTLAQVGGMLLILSGVYLVNSKQVA